MDVQLTATVSMFRALAQRQLGVLQYFFVEAQRKTTRDGSERGLRQSIMSLASGCRLTVVPEAQRALHCYALVSRQAYSTTFASGRSATEYVLEVCMRGIGFFSNTQRANLLHPGGPTEQELPSLIGAMPVFVESLRKSGALPDMNFCAQLSGEIEWEAVRAMAYAGTVESGGETNRPQEKRGRTSRHQGTKPDKFRERDDEIERLADEKLPGGKRRSAGDIFLLIKTRWPVMENKKPLNAKAVAAALRRRRESCL